MRLFRKRQGRPGEPVDGRSRARIRSASEALREGAGATGRRLSSGRRGGPGGGGGLDSVLRAILRPILLALTVVVRAIVAVAVIIAGPVRTVASRVLDTASRELTPVRVLALVAIGAAVLLALSQFADYRGIGVGTDKYHGVESVAPPPEVGREEAGSAHSYVFVPLAVVAIAAIGFALRGRWRLTRIAVVVGIAAVLVALLIDRPAGLDEGMAAIEFEGAKASLLGGFWAQMAAGVVLAVTSVLLGNELRAEGPVRGRAAIRAPRLRRRSSLPEARA